MQLQPIRKYSLVGKRAASSSTSIDSAPRLTFMAIPPKNANIDSSKFMPLASLQAQDISGS